MACFHRGDSQVMIKAWIMLVMAICKGFPTLPHKGGLAERQRVLRHCLWVGTTRSPSLSRCQSNNTMLQLLLCPQPPSYLLSLPLPAPCSHHPHFGHREWWHGVFLSGECGLLVNSWATIHSECKSSQVKTWWLCTSMQQQRAEDMNTEQQNKPAVFFNESLVHI